MNESPLAHELRFGTLDGVRKLLAGGLDPNACGDFHLSSSEFEGKLDALLSHGWDVDRCQLLHDAKHGLGKRVELYLEKGADPNAVDANGQSALHKFARLGIGKAAIKALVQAGANPDAKDQEGNTPLNLAKLAKRKAALHILSELSRE